jgi:putative glutamine amidotransferase
VLVAACNKQLGDHLFHVAGHKYVDAVRLAGGLPLVVPRAGPDDLDALLDLADGVLLTGSVSNVHPSHFNEPVHDPALPMDPLRDDWTLPLIRRLVDRGLPLLAICLGAQEVNVALGGALHQAVHASQGPRGAYADHRAPAGQPAEVQYGPAHPVAVQPGGWLHRLGLGEGFMVNSVHGQGVARLAPGLRIEAVAPDGLVEAFSIGGDDRFQLAVQWHPEWRAAKNPVSMRILKAFGEALCRQRDHSTHPIRPR